MLLRLVGHEFGRVLRSPFLWGAVLLAVGVQLFWARNYCFLGNTFERYNCNAYDLMIFMQDGLANILAPVFAALPFAGSLAHDLSQGYVRQVMVRANLNKYLLAKAIVNGVGGAAVVGGVALIVFLAGNLVFPRGLMANSRMIPGNVPYGPLGHLYTQVPDLYILFLVALAGMVGFVYATLGLAMAGLTRNRYLAVGIPLLVFHVAAQGIYFLSGVLPSLVSLNPYYLFIPFRYPDANLPAMLGGLAVTLVISIVLLTWSTRRGRMIP